MPYHCATPGQSKGLTIVWYNQNALYSKDNAALISVILGQRKGVSMEWSTDI